MSETFVLDASALLCVLLRELGGDRVRALLNESCISAVNFAEVFSKLTEQATPPETLHAALAAFDLNVVPFDREAAEFAGSMRSETRKAGLSLGDRCCLALAKQLGAVALTADRAWAELDLGIRVELIR